MPALPSTTPKAVEELASYLYSRSREANGFRPRPFREEAAPTRARFLHDARAVFEWFEEFAAALHMFESPDRARTAPEPSDDAVDAAARLLYGSYREHANFPLARWEEVPASEQLRWRDSTRDLLLYLGLSNSADTPDEQHEDYGQVVSQRNRLLHAARRVAAADDLALGDDVVIALGHVIDEVTAEVEPQPEAPREWRMPASPDDEVDEIQDSDGGVWHPHPGHRGVWRRTRSVAESEHRFEGDPDYVEARWETLLSQNGVLREHRETPLDAARRRLRAFGPISIDDDLPDQVTADLALVVNHKIRQVQW